MYWDNMHGTTKECFHTTNGAITPFVWEHWALVYDPSGRTFTGYKNGN